MRINYPVVLNKYIFLQYQVFKKSKSTVPVKTIATAVIKGRKVDLKRFSSTFAAFCGDFVAYKGKQVYHRIFFQPQQNETNGKYKFNIKIV